MALVEDAPLLLPEGSVGLLRDLIHERLGIYFDSGRLDSMVDKLQDPARFRKCQSLLDYYYLLKYDETAQGEWEHVMDALSVQETYFWREMPQIQALVDVLIPKWFKDRSMPLRIWSAACATGEEPYTIAIALQEGGWANHPIQILASDASPAALVKARRGIYRERSFRSLPADIREKYFAAVPQGWQLRSDILSRVQFQRANIVAQNEVAWLAAAPVIFCRNVFIYFSPEAIRRTLSVFAEFMPSNGHLFVGASESLLKLTPDFELEEIDDAFVYVRHDRLPKRPPA
jgi:chemotaxis protein methyltransferase CheR